MSTSLRSSTTPGRSVAVTGAELRAALERDDGNAWRRPNVVAGVDIQPSHGLRLLTVCGSLQRRSANRAALDVATAAAAGAIVDGFDRLGDIPPFDADRADEQIPVVEEWRQRVGRADVVIVAAPEYAGGVAGVLKNALDWLVGSGELYRKPVAVLSAGTSGGLHARRTTAQTLTWQGAYVVAELGIAAPRTKFDDAGRLRDDATAAAIAAVVATALVAPTMASAELVATATAVVRSLGVDTAHVAPAA
jgi:chromate reductase, NAD(P)H dehydrogenase (quinone)